jgi:nucleoside-diphosphate-sugar epimerase
MQWLMLQQEEPEDFVIATGVQYSVRDFVNAAAKELGMEIRWEGEGVDEKGFWANRSIPASPVESVPGPSRDGGAIVAVDPRYFRPTEVETLLGDPTHAREKLGWTPRIGFEALVAEMVREDLRTAERDELSRKHGLQDDGLPRMTEPRIYVAGHRGMVGAAIVRRLQYTGDTKLITRTHAELDLTDQAQVRAFFSAERPDQVYLAAARVGGIHANNTYPAEFIYENLMIEANIIRAAHESGVQRLLFLGSSCIYPKLAEQPMREDALLTGTLEPTNEPYAIAKIAGIKLCESYNRQYGRDYRSVMPTNLYGPGDNFHPENSHVIPALLRRFHDAVQAGAHEVTIWGTALRCGNFCTWMTWRRPACT